jgi:4-hydroxy-3-methylbut-2-enyl diphosphate reductase
LPGERSPEPVYWWVVQPLIFRKGLDLKDAVKGELARDYHSDVVERIRSSDFRFDEGRLTIHLAREFGFCYGVDRAVDYAYQARKRFADQRVFLTGEIIHNPHVNQKLRTAGIRFLSDPGEPAPPLGEGDVVIIPAFGVTVHELARLQGLGCTLVDTTCGSVLNVWKNVTRYAREGFTAVIHGKVKHEETQATASQALRTPGGRYLVVLDRAEADEVCAYIRGEGNRDAFMARFGKAVSAGFDPDRDLGHVGLANQTTMLMSESLEIADMLRLAMVDRYGAEALAERYRAFDTICSATQERQDAVLALLETEALDLMLVVGGYNSSNTCNLARICADRVPTYHIADVDRLESPERIRHRPVPPSDQPLAKLPETVTDGWLPASGPLRVGLTAGASTPNNIIGMVVERLSAFAAGPSR